MLKPLAFIYLTAATACAMNLYAGSDFGNLTSLRLTRSNGTYLLEKQYTYQECGNRPVWLSLDSSEKVLFCLDREGAITTFRTSESGALTMLDRKNTTIGPVSNAFFNSDERRGMVAAHYAGSAVSVWNAPLSGSLELIQTFIFDGPTGPLDQQSVPHPHDAILDPTGKYIVVPDLGADRLRIFTFDPNTNMLTEIDQVVTAPASGPRHAEFWSPEDASYPDLLYFHVLAEIGSTITSFKVTYPECGGLKMEDIGVVSSYGDYSKAVNGIAAELEVSPDNRFIMASNRNSSTFTIPSLTPGNSTTEESDSIAVYEPKTNGKLSFVQLVPSGGPWPRHFKLNKAGDLVAVSLQYSGRVVIMERDVKTGFLGPIVAHVDGLGEVVVTVWDE